MKQKLFLLSIIVFSFIITGCSRNNSLAYDESIQVQKEENKLDNNMDRIKDLKNSIYKFITDDIKSNGGHVKDFDLDNSNFVANSTFEIKKNRDDVISILVKYYKYSGGAHGYYEYIPYNIDLRKGNFIALKDIFKDNVKK